MRDADPGRRCCCCFEPMYGVGSRACGACLEAHCMAGGPCRRDPRTKQRPLDDLLDPAPDDRGAGPISDSAVEKAFRELGRRDR